MQQRPDMRQPGLNIQRHVSPEVAQAIGHARAVVAQDFTGRGLQEDRRAAIKFAEKWRDARIVSRTTLQNEVAQLADAGRRK